MAQCERQPLFGSTDLTHNRSMVKNCSKQQDQEQSAQQNNYAKIESHFSKSNQKLQHGSQTHSSQQQQLVVKKFNYELRSHKGQYTEDEAQVKKSDKSNSLGGRRQLRSPSERGRIKDFELNSNIYNIAFGELKSIQQTISGGSVRTQIRVRSGRIKQVEKSNKLASELQEEKLQHQINQIKLDLHSLRNKRSNARKEEGLNNTIDLAQAQSLFEYCSRISRKNAEGAAEAEQIMRLLKRKKHLWKRGETSDVGILAKPTDITNSRTMNNQTRELTFAGSDTESQKGRMQAQDTVQKGSIKQIIEYIQIQPPANKQPQLVTQVSLKDMKMPKLPQRPNKDINSRQLIQIGRKLFSLFGACQTNEKISINVSKYNNCFSFSNGPITILWYDTGRFYIGGYRMLKQEGQKHGKGIQYMPKRYLYDGQFRNNRKSGFGSLRYSNGDSYEGQFYNGLKHGKGKLMQNNCTIYNGQWKNQKMDGFGVLQLANGDHYEGYFQCGAQNGYGILKFSNGDEFKGEFVQGKFYGKGTYLWVNGESYQGEFVNGSKHGKGKWRSGKEQGSDVYVGEYKNDKKCGYGKYCWKDGTVYEGQFENDQKHGVGILTQNGKVTKGLWQNGKHSRAFENEARSSQLQEYYKNGRKTLQSRESSKRGNSSSLSRKHRTVSDSNTLSSSSRAKSIPSSTPYQAMQCFKRLEAIY